MPCGQVLAHVAGRLGDPGWEVELVDFLPHSFHLHMDTVNYGLPEQTAGKDHLYPRGEPQAR